MDKRQPHPRSHLFTVRLWREELGGGQAEWRGKAHHVTSGETHYFRDWSRLIAFLIAMLPDADEGNLTTQGGIDRGQDV